jgi:hypothetical protein
MLIERRVISRRTTDLKIRSTTEQLTTYRRILPITYIAKRDTILRNARTKININLIV